MAKKIRKIKKKKRNHLEIGIKRKNLSIELQKIHNEKQNENEKKLNCTILQYPTCVEPSVA